MNDPRVEIVTLNWNGKDNTLECLKSVKNLNYSNFHITVVDNASEDGSPEAIKELYPDVNVIVNRANLGYAEGFNTGLRYALKNGVDYILIMNNDAVIDQNALKSLVKTAQSDPMIGFVSGKVFHYNKPEVLQSVGIKWDARKMEGWLIGNGEVDIGQFDRVEKREFVDDVFLLVRREVVEKVGGYDHNFFLYFEEADWNARVKKAGFKIMYTPMAKIWHKGMSSTGGRPNPKYFYFFTRNRFLFIRRNYKASSFYTFLLKQFCWFIPLTSLRFLKHKEIKNLWGYLRGWLSGIQWWLRIELKNIKKAINLNASVKDCSSEHRIISQL